MRNLILLILIKLIFISSASSQIADIKIETSIVQSSYFDVKIFIKRNGASEWKLGNASFVFNYNFSALVNPIEQQEGIFDNNTSQYYGDQFISNYNNTSESVEIYFLGQPGQGTLIPAIFTLLGTVRFNIQNPNAMHNINWNNNYSAITDDEGNEKTQLVNFINPQNGLLPVINSGNNLLLKDYLLNNYPNPFNSSTKFYYGLSNDGFLKLSIFGINGREYPLFYGYQKSGNYTFEVNLNDFSSGIYFLKMITINNFFQNKMILIK